MDVPETRFAFLGGDRIAYQVLGEGPPDLVFLAGMSGHVDVRWEDPLHAEFLKRLASFSRLIVFDRRGTGASDPFPLEVLPAWEAWADDVRAVMDAAGSKSASLFAQADAGPMALVFAATEPERTHSLILANAPPRMVPDDDYPADAMSTEDRAALARLLGERWGTEDWTDVAYPSMRTDGRFRAWFAKYLRASCSPREAGTYLEAMLHLDARHVLPTIRVPTLVLHRGSCELLPVEWGRRTAEGIAGARFQIVPGTDYGIVADHPELLLDHVQEFVTGVRRGPDLGRVLASILFTDIVSSTERARSLGDRRWSEQLHDHDSLARSLIERFRGSMIKATGDGVVATFDGPGRAIGCATAMREGLRSMSLSIRCGIHSGEIEIRGDDIGGIGVHIAARVMAQAGPDEILVSRTVKDLVAGSHGLTFRDRGHHTLKGIEDRWQLFTVEMT